MKKKALKQLREAADYLLQQYPETPEAGIVLGSGLGDFTRDVIIEREIPYGAIPHFPVSTVEGHEGRLIFGQLRGKTVALLAGRFHTYEGYSPEEIVFPIRVLKLLGVRTLFLSNAAGSVNPGYRVGDIVVIRDHISFFMPNPLLGRNWPELGPRFVDMSDAYDAGLRERARIIALAQGFELHEGVYTAVTGPTYETPAEYRMLYTLGADLVGMSTIAETIAARHLGMRVFALSVVTDLGYPEQPHPITHDQVLQAAKEAEPRVAVLLKEMIAGL